MQNHAKWRFGWKKKLSQKGLNFGMRTSFRLRNIALKFFRRVALSFRELTYAKNLAFPDHVFVFTCLLNRKQANCLPYSVQSQNQISELIEAEIWEQIVYIGYCDVKHNARIDRPSKEMPSKKLKEMWCVRVLSTNILSIVFKYLVELPGGWEAS